MGEELGYPENLDNDTLTNLEKHYAGVRDLPKKAVSRGDRSFEFSTISIRRSYRIRWLYSEKQ